MQSVFKWPPGVFDTRQDGVGDSGRVSASFSYFFDSMIFFSMCLGRLPVVLVGWLFHWLEYLHEGNIRSVRSNIHYYGTIYIQTICGRRTGNYAETAADLIFFPATALFPRTTYCICILHFACICNLIPKLSSSLGRLSNWSLNLQVCIAYRNRPRLHT